MTDTNVARSLPQAISLSHLTDAEVLAGVRRLVGRSNQLLAELLAHLVEVESRGIHRTRACSSLYVYCIYELRFSEDEAFRRVTAARLIKRFPALLDAVASGELHLTGLIMLGPHLTDSNLTEVLARAKHRTKRELARLVRVLDPLPAVPARIEPLGPAPARGIPDGPRWDTFVQGFAPVRQLEPGARPRDWAESTNRTADETSEHGAELAGPIDDTPIPAPPELPALARTEAVRDDSLTPERYKVQFTATEEYVRLVEEAKALLAHAAPRVTLEDIHLRAIRTLVSTLKKRKYATKPRAGREEHASMPEGARARPLKQQTARGPKVMPTHPRRRGRHIPAEVRRAVLERDGARCTYVDASGRTCAETRRLEFHHLRPFAAGGEHEASNLTLRCASHNALAADEDFGRERMQDQRSPGTHDRFRDADPAVPPRAG